MESGSPPPDQIARVKRYVEKLNSGSPVERDRARRALDELGASKLDVLIALLQSEVAGRRRKRRAITIAICGYLAIAVSSVIISLATGHHINSHLFTPFTWMGGIIGGAFAVSGAQKNATKVLAEFDDKRAVGWWALALTYPEREIKSLARTKLIALLPKLSASDAHLFDEEQRNALNQALSQWSESEAFPVALLNALEQIGDERAVPYVEKLAAGHGMAARSLRVRAAAKACLPALHERIQLAKESATLLRGASVSSASVAPDLLLRPASGAANGQAAGELLRAAAPDSEGTPLTTEVASRAASHIADAHGEPQ
ncbi:MAG TPA: hypothetical protein VKT77_21810 [Chthonomonadaceae bacterium]|nr:hypothetical protein [Chthonomonadaceae bacterium]